MSTAKRSRQRQTEPRSASPLPASKRVKTTNTSHVPAPPGLGFLVDESARAGRKLDAKLTNGLPSSKTTRVDDSHAVVASDTRDQAESDEVGGTQDTAIDISSSEDESEDDEDEVPQRHNVVSKRDQLEQQSLVNGSLSEAEDEDGEAGQDAVAGADDIEMAQPEQDGDDVDDQEPEEPSLGDMLQARHPDPIDVQASMPNLMADRRALVPASGQRTLSAPSGTSLGTVLTQALKTNDKNLLESCFQTTHHATIRSTVQRLQSHHVATLLERLAERMHRSPGRTSTLMIWVHWALVAHGGYLASQPELMKQLKSLSQVVRERASGLQPLLQLKGKLDMLSAQLELRRTLQAESRAANAEDDDDEEGVVYVEGQDDDWSDSEVAEDEVRVDSKMLDAPISKPKLQTATPRTDYSQSDESSDSDDDMRNGVAQEGNDDSSEAGEEEDEGMLDLEAEEKSDSDGNDEDEDSDEEVDSEPESEDSEPSDDESDDSGVRQPKVSMLNRKR